MRKEIRVQIAETLFGKPPEDKPYCALNCANPSHEFRDALSVKEFGISGLCMNCQDVVFGDPDA